MKRSLLAFLVCPGCKSEFNLRVRSQDEAEITDGSLSCRGCGAEYPILRGIPRFVAAESYASSFGHEWSWFRTVQQDSCNGDGESERMLEGATGWKDEDYKGRLVLDAGVGAGRYAEIVAKKGGEVIGIDLSQAIEAAYANLGQHERVHLIQADIFAMPFREGTFDLAYSVGVVHHTPDPRAAFGRLAAAVKPAGSLAVYVYAIHGAHFFSNVIRKVTTRLPLRLMFALTALSIPLYYCYRLPLLGKVLQHLGPISMHPNWRCRWLDTFDWYTPKYQWKLTYPEVYRWFRENGLVNIEIFPDPIRMRGVKSDRKREEAQGHEEKRLEESPRETASYSNLRRRATRKQRGHERAQL